MATRLEKVLKLNSKKEKIHTLALIYDFHEHAWCNFFFSQIAFLLPFSLLSTDWMNEALYRHQN
jgi:hypothetical protein